MRSDFKQLVDALPGLIWIAEPDGALDFINRGWREYSGLTDAQAAGSGWHGVVHPDDLGAVLGAWSDAVATGQGREVEARMRRHDGEYRMFLFRTSPLTDDTGRVTKWCGINTDVEDRWQADHAVRERHNHFSSAFDDLPIIFGLGTADGETDLVNAAAVEYFGVTLSALKKMPLRPTSCPRIDRRSWRSGPRRATAEHLMIWRRAATVKRSPLAASNAASLLGASRSARQLVEARCLPASGCLSAPRRLQVPMGRLQPAAR